MDFRSAHCGRPTTRLVRDTIRELKGDDPLAAVTVVVPSNLAGLSLRRLFGADQLDPSPVSGPRGIAHVGFATPFQLAGRLALPTLSHSGLRPLTTAVLASAVRHVLRDGNDRFGSVAEHVATERALIRAYQELRQLGPNELAVLRADGSAQTRDLVAFADAVRDHLTRGQGQVRFHDETDVFDAAETALAAGVDEKFVLVGPFESSQPSNRFLRALASLPAAIVVMPLTGDAGVDQRSHQAFDRPPDPGTLSVRPTSFLPAADSDEECRAVVREVLRLAESGARFDRIAVFTPMRNPYSRVLRELLASADIPTAGPDYRRLADSMVGRLVLRLLDLASPKSTVIDHRFDRDRVIALAMAAPILGPDGKRIRPGPWETISREAGVIGGLDDWSEKLHAHIDGLHAKHERAQRESRSVGSLDAIARQARVSAELRAFVLWLASTTESTTVGPTWAERSDWLSNALEVLLPPEHQRSAWPAAEVDAAERINALVERVRLLDVVEPEAPWSAFVRALEIELESPLGSLGRVGTGVLIAPLASSALIDVDHVLVLGMAEGICPAVVREDSLLPDTERQLVGGTLPGRDDRFIRERERYLHAQAAGLHSTTLLMPVGDHRNGRTRSASRWWLESLIAAGAPQTTTAENWPDVDVPELVASRSFVQSLRAATEVGQALSSADLDLHRAHDAVTAGGSVIDLDFDRRHLGRSLETAVSSQVGFTRFNGNLAGESFDEVGSDERAVSASRLQQWAECPRKYYFSEVLGLGEVERPDRIVEITPRDRGSLWHAILESFLAEALPGEPHQRTSPDHEWTEEDRRRLHAHADRSFEEYENMGLTGRPLLWRIEQESIRADLDRFITEDNDLRRNLRSTPHAVEMAIGFPRNDGEEPSPPAIVELPNGRELRLRGFADRVDVRNDGSPVVIDYKTGRSDGVRKSLERDPVDEGTKLQLGVYAEAARQDLGTTRAAAYYWYTSTRGKFASAGYDWTESEQARFGDALLSIVTGIEAGSFPPNPGEYQSFFGSFTNCRYCDFNRVCRTDRDHELTRAIEEGELVDFLRLRVQPGADES